MNAKEIADNTIKNLINDRQEIYGNLKGILQEDLTRAEANILKILGKYEFDENNQVK